MRISRKTIWVSVAYFILLACALVAYFQYRGAQFSVSGINNSAVHVPPHVYTGSRYPQLNGPLIAVAGGGTAQNGLSLRMLLPMISTYEKQVYAIRSLDGIYPDGTSAHFEVLYAASGSAHRLLIGKAGIISDEVISGTFPAHTPLPLNFPDSKDALLQLTANPYFKEAHASGMALYYDAAVKRWSYLVRTDLGDVNILIPKAAH